MSDEQVAPWSAVDAASDDSAVTEQAETLVEAIAAIDSGVRRRVMAALLRAITAEGQL